MPMSCYRPLLRLVLFTLLLALLAACSATSTFLPHPLRIEPYKAQLASGVTVPASNLLSAELRSKDRILYAMERGRLAQLAGDLATSRQDFATAIAAIAENDRKATISASGLGANLAAITVNDNAIPYRGEGYERVLLHHYQALNYLLAGEIEGAAVEFRWANAEQDHALQQHAEEVSAAEAQALSAQLGTLLADSTVQYRYAQLDERVGAVKNSFQNPYSFYLSGLVYELRDEANDAYIDYKKALEIVPESQTLQRDVLRLARRLGMDEDYQDFSRRFPAIAAELDAQPATRDTGELVVLYEEDFVPPREEIKIPFPVPSGLATVAFPFYAAPWQPDRPLLVIWDEQQLGRTELLCNIRGLAAKSLRERFPVLLTRQLLRLATKLAAQKLAQDQFGDLGMLIFNLYGFLSENADLRSWLSLPQTAQVLRVTLPAGEQRIGFVAEEINLGEELSVTIPPKGIALLYVARIGSHYYPATVSWPH